MSNFDSFVNGAVEKLTEVTTDANTIADKIINADNQNQLIHEVRETSDDEQIVKYREYYEKGMAALNKAQENIDRYIVDAGLVSTEPVDVPTETENYNTLKSQIKAMVNMLKTIPGGDEAAANLPELKNIPGTRKSSGTSGGGTGTRRPRISKLVVDYGDGVPVDLYETKKGENGQPDKTVANLTVLAGALSKKFDTKIEVKDLQAELFANAGTEDLSTLNGKPVSFPVTIVQGTDENAVSTIVNVTATPTVK